MRVLIVENKARRPKGELFCVSCNQHTSCGVLKYKLQLETRAGQCRRPQPRKYCLAIFQHASRESRELIFEDCSSKDNPDENLCDIICTNLNCASLCIA